MRLDNISIALRWQSDQRLHSWMRTLILKMREEKAQSANARRGACGGEVAPAGEFAMTSVRLVWTSLLRLQGRVASAIKQDPCASIFSSRSLEFIYTM